MVLSRDRSIPPLVASHSAIAWARRSESALLDAGSPFESVWPSTWTGASDGTSSRIDAASSVSDFSAYGLMSALPKSNRTSASML